MAEHRIPDDPAAAAEARYGGAPAPGVREDANGVVPLLLRHHSVRHFSDEPIDDTTVDTLIAAAQSASTSSNLQVWSVVVLRDPERKDQAAALAGDQDFIRQAPLFLVFVADWSRGRTLAREAGREPEALDYLESTMVGAIDAAIAAQNTVVAAQALGYGTVYVGAVRNRAAQMADFLGLPEGSFPVAGLAIGTAHPDESAAVKPRLPQRIVRHDETYRPAVADELTRYDEALRAHNSRHGRSRGWQDGVVTRVTDTAALHGREQLRQTLADRGLPSH
ncbi:NADPH-dependent oxidoreductase [Microbacterium sp. LRZ72]|uniref:NADPH-dependent oxidoreductase n=1 Tax=Microbacterium sp. LRZ72 TaxID=2942481 RepID=UPI0029BB1A5E|nr:NADPH-dependent oxidoreductase [Microbacterium sp. LRZ72]MDX2375873.1 NADPH-dependent oxidoreductase [Microbacterium sp. LRZ72]